jgi:hypothetical protein
MATGTMITMRFMRAQGYPYERRFLVRIPQGVRTGARVRLVFDGGGEDIVLTVRVI